eukprot:1772279-Pleurochrysis_carterae.AAC.1
MRHVPERSSTASERISLLAFFHSTRLLHIQRSPADRGAAVWGRAGATHSLGSQLAWGGGLGGRVPTFMRCGKQLAKRHPGVSQRGILRSCKEASWSLAKRHPG